MIAIWPPRALAVTVTVATTGRISVDAAGGLIGRNFGPKKEKLKYSSVAKYFKAVAKYFKF